MNHGTNVGDIAEVEFVSVFNSNKTNFKSYLKHFDKYKNPWMIRVTTKQISSLSGKKVFTRADCYLANIISDISKLVINNNYYLDEDILEANNIKFEKIPYSGISIKMTNSEDFQILKMQPDSLKNLLGSYELGAGASLYCKKECELDKNYDLIYGWKSSIEKMISHFNIFTENNVDFYHNKEICTKIKEYASKEIKNKIDTSTEIQKKVFNGIGLYKEPYTAFYFYHGKDILELSTIPFYVTTGSGRSKGEYTIVLKPL